MPPLPITQHPRTAVALQGLLARLQELAQILIVQEAFAVHVHRLLDLLARKRAEHPPWRSKRSMIFDIHSSNVSMSSIIRQAIYG